jgi:flap endonuclease-1
MGLNIRDIIPRKEIEIEKLSGKTLCVDAYNILYQFLTTIRQIDGTPLKDSKNRITSHLSGIFYRNLYLLNYGIKLIYVFDGTPPDLKFKTAKLRNETKNFFKEKYEKAKKEKNIDEMKKYSSQLIYLEKEMIEESKELLNAMGIQTVMALGEGEEEAAYLSKVKEDIYASVSQDYDSLLFGAKRLIRNLTLSKKKKLFNGTYSEIKTELIELEKVLNFLEIDLDQLICLGILVGTDYNPRGVPGIGQKRALEIVKKYKQPIFIFKSVEEQIMNLSEEDQFDWREIFKLFHNYNVKDVDIKFDKTNPEKIREILIKRHDFSEERVNKQLEKLSEIEEKNKQKGLKDWF